MSSISITTVSLLYDRAVSIERQFVGWLSRVYNETTQILVLVGNNPTDYFFCDDAVSIYFSSRLNESRNDQNVLFY